MSKIAFCECKHEYQDKVYGKQQRVHNAGPKCYANNPGFRCTVCGNTRA